MKFVINAKSRSKVNAVIFVDQSFPSKSHLSTLIGPELYATLKEEFEEWSFDAGLKCSTLVLDSDLVQELKVVQVGEKFEGSLSEWSDLIGDISRYSWSKADRNVVVMVPQKPKDVDNFCRVFSESYVLGTYAFPKYGAKASKKDAPKTVILQLPSIKLTSGLQKQLNQALLLGSQIGDAVNQARDLSNTPANYLTPTEFKDRAKKLKGIKVEVIDEKKAEKLGMGGFLAVSQGSEQPGFMVVMTYQGAGRRDPYMALMGKGVTFDTGGISIKPSSGMAAMKGDMGGAAAVFATMQALSEIKPKCNVMAVIGLVENMPSHKAYKPGDVITMYSGKTVEITNTDAEGRMVLADGLAYLSEKKPACLVDLATLTGACSIALGDAAAGICSNDDALAQHFLEGVKESCEELWRLPLYPKFLDYLKSDVADMINANENRLAGTATAAMFLKQFVGDTKWLHIDIASKMSNTKTSGTEVKGMSGFGVRTLLNFLLNSTGNF